MGDEIPSEAYKVKCPGCGHRNLEGRVLCFGCGKRLGGGYAMTTEGEQQEAVCGTCGHLETSHLGRGANYQRGICYMRDCGCVSFTLAPVVPGDDECQACNGEGGGYVSVGANEWDAQQCDVCRGTGRRPSPPTPSQDAEGDGRKALLLRIKRMTGREPVGVGDLLNILTHPDCIEFTEAWLESAIREPYEALVREQAEAYHGLVCADRLSNWPTRFEDCPESACRKATATLTSIEESLGGPS